MPSAEGTLERFHPSQQLHHHLVALILAATQLLDFIAQLSDQIVMDGECLVDVVLAAAPEEPLPTLGGVLSALF